VDDFETAVATYWTACRPWPKAKITLRAGSADYREDLGGLARFFFSSRLTQLSIRFLASARASFRVPLRFTTLGLPPMLSGNEISRTHSSRPRPARMAYSIPSYVMAGHGFFFRRLSGQRPRRDHWRNDTPFGIS